MSSSVPRIRLRYSSMVNYLAMTYRTLVAIGFIIVVARKLTISEYGLWGIILSTTQMLSSLVSLWNFWMSRYLGRGFSEAFGSAIALSTIYWVVGGAVYAVLAYGEYLILGWGLPYLMLGVLIFIFNIYFSTVNSALSVVKPEGMGYIRFIYETSRIVLAYLFVVVLSFKLSGAVLAMALSLAIGSIEGLRILLRLRTVSLKPSKSLMLRWLKGIYIPVISVVNGFLLNGLRAFTAWLTASDVPVAYLNVGLSAQAPILTASSATTPALYARALKKPQGSDLSEVLKIYFLITGFLTFTFIVLSKPIATLYNPVYKDAYIIVSVISLYALVTGLISIHSTLLMGGEKVDVEGSMSFNELRSSYLFKIPFLMLAATIATYGMSASAIMLSQDKSFLTDSLYVVASLAISSILPLPYVLREVRKLVTYKFPRREALTTLVAGGAMTLFYVFAGFNNITVHSFWRDGVTLAIAVGIGGSIYVAVWLIMSKWLRGLVKLALSELLH